MNPEENITLLIDQLRGGNREAVGPIWDHFFKQMMALARQKLGPMSRAAADEEDVALSAFNSVCLDLEQGRYSQVLDREGLWRLLVAVTLGKVVDLWRQQRSQKRGGGQILGESVLDAPGASTCAGGMARVPDSEPDAALAAAMGEECSRLLGLLDDRLRELVLLKLEGYSNREVAAKLGCALRTVERKLGVIRDLWEHESP